MRLFTAISFDENVLSALGRAADIARLAGVVGRFAKRENLHLTLCFLGEVPISRLADVKQAVFRAAQGHPPFSLSFLRPGMFRRPGGDVFWIGLSPSNALLDLQAHQSAALIKAGFLLEQRSYSPHITLARDVRLPAGKNLSNIAFPDLVPITVRDVRIFESSYVNGRLIYNPLQVIKL